MLKLPIMKNESLIVYDIDFLWSKKLEKSEEYSLLKEQYPFDGFYNLKTGEHFSCDISFPDYVKRTLKECRRNKIETTFTYTTSRKPNTFLKMDDIFIPNDNRVMEQLLNYLSALTFEVDKTKHIDLYPFFGIEEEINAEKLQKELVFVLSRLTIIASNEINNPEEFKNQLLELRNAIASKQHLDSTKKELDRLVSFGRFNGEIFSSLIDFVSESKMKVAEKSLLFELK